MKFDAKIYSNQYAEWEFERANQPLQAEFQILHLSLDLQFQIPNIKHRIYPPLERGFRFVNSTLIQISHPT